MIQMPSSPAVLVVEDDPNTLAGYVEILEAAGLQAAGIANGADALGVAINTLPDIVVTDITLPGMDGLSLAEALRADGRTRGIPVIGLTAQWSPDVRGHATRAGISTLLLKPCMPDHLLAEIRRTLKHARETSRHAPAES